MTNSQIEAKLKELSRRICCVNKSVEDIDAIASIVEGDNITVDNTDPLNPIISANLSVDQLDTLSSISTYNGTSDVLIVTEDNKNGVFSKYSGSYADDGGVVITDANGQKWKRVINDYIDIRWYGAAPTTGTSINSTSAINNAYIAAKSTEIIPTPRLYIPSTGASNMWYYSTAQITFDGYVEVFGDGTNSHIRFAANVGGFITTYITSRYSKFRDFQLSSYVGGTLDFTKAGFIPRDIVYVNNVVIKEFSDGVQCIAAVPTGNTNNSIFTNLRVLQNRRHGVFIDGPDANNITFYNLDATSNGGCGVLDSSFLGNHYYTPHFATNSSPTLAWQKGLTIYGGVVYQSLKDNNIAIEPTVTAGWANYWETNATIQVWSIYLTAWSAATTYHTGAPYFFEGASQWGSMNNAYIEGDQPLPTLSARSTAIGGNITHRGTTTGTMKAFEGYLYTKDNFRIGNVPDNSTDVVVKLGSGVGGGTKGVGVTTINPAGVWFDYFPGSTFGGNMGGIKTQAGTSKVRFLTTGCTATNAGRTNAPDAGATLALIGPMYFSFTGSRTMLRELDFTGGGNPIYSASTATKDAGDMVLMTKNDLFSKADYICAKVIEPVTTGTKKWVGVKGFEEQMLTNITGTYVIGRDINVSAGRGILYDVMFVGTSGSDTCVLHHEILVINTAGVMSVANNVAIRADLVPGAFATTAINMNLYSGSANDDVEVQIINLPASTNGKINIKRIEY